LYAISIEITKYRGVLSLDEYEVLKVMAQ